MWNGAAAHSVLISFRCVLSSDAAAASASGGSHRAAVAVYRYAVPLLRVPLQEERMSEEILRVFSGEEEHIPCNYHAMLSSSTQTMLLCICETNTCWLMYFSLMRVVCVLHVCQAQVPCQNRCRCMDCKNTIEAAVFATEQMMSSQLKNGTANSALQAGLSGGPLLFSLGAAPVAPVEHSLPAPSVSSGMPLEVSSQERPVALDAAPTTHNNR